MNPIKSFRNPILSLWQSAIHKVVSASEPQNAQRLSSAHPMMTQFVAAAQAQQQGAPPPATDGSGNTIDECAKLAAAIAWAEIRRDAQRVTELSNELHDSQCDPRWAEALAAYLGFKASGGSIPYVRYQSLDDFVIELPAKDQLVIGLIADWGTGAEDAQWLLSQVMQQKPDVLIHLGDIYYAGTQDEMQSNFLNIIQATAGSIPVYTLSGNHDMYAGGAPYYWLLQQLNQNQPAALRQPASYFCLRTQNWQLLAMDTGLHDCDPFTVTTNVTYLDPAEAAWHLDKLANDGGRQTVLLSHHQLYSAVGVAVGADPQGQHIAFNPHLQNTFASYLSNVALWLWGHEHNLVVFDPYINLQKGRCIGSGAIPMMIDENPYTPNPNFDLQGQSGPPVMNLQDAQLSTNADGFYYHAYAIMTLNDADATAVVDYYQVDSTDQGESLHLFSEKIE